MAEVAAKRPRDLFDTKPRIILVFDPETAKVEEVVKAVRHALETPKVPGFRGCLPCAASGMDLFAFESLVLPQLQH